MCNEACINFGIACVNSSDVVGKRVLEVGARDINGSLRPHIESLHPSSYVGVDFEDGPGVDEIWRAEQLVERFGSDSFDVVVSTEMLEHVLDWRSVVSNLKQVVKPGGILVLTTRSRGFGFHGYPFDFWRYEESDFRFIFADFGIEVLMTDSSAPGVFFKGRKPADFRERNIDGYQLYSVITEKWTSNVKTHDIVAFHVRYLSRLAIARVPPSIRQAWISETIGRRAKKFLRL